MFDHLRHLLVPHHTNNYRAKILHLDFFAFYLVFLFSASFLLRIGHLINPDILGYATDIQVEKLVEYTNQKRAEAGVGPVKLNPTLSQAAAGKARDMFSNDYWAHNSPQGKTPWDFILGAGYRYLVAGENLAKNFSDSQGVVEAWMNSPSHKENLLRGQYEDVGFAVVNGTLSGEETTLVVQMFGKPSESQIAQVPPPPPASFIPPVAQAEAQETLEVFPTVAPIAQVSPLASPITAVVLSEPQYTVSQPSPLLLAYNYVKRPLVDLMGLAKRFTLGISLLLLAALTFDMWYVWRHKIVRVGGKSSAHLLFLFGITAVVWGMQLGSIL